MIADLKEMLTERLDLWYRTNKSYPERILFYRDGVSEGEFLHVLNQELPQIKAALEPENLNSKQERPKVTLLVVGKRHNTRFYATKESAGFTDNTSNLCPGLVVDRGATSVLYFDFFLQAHKGLKGHARPAHYYVLHDENEFSADDLQTLTHALCYQFGRATSSVSYCPPAYYADLACERGRCYIHGMLNAPNGSKATYGKTKVSDDDKQNSLKIARGLWGNGIHKNLAETMFYI